jgi:hypothetical protein
MPAMEISYELTEKDFSEALVVHRNRNTLSKWSRRILISVVTIGAAIVVVSFLVNPGVPAAKDLLPLLALVVVWIALLYILPRWTMRRQFRKQPGAHGPRKVLLDSSGAHWRWNGGSADVEWKNYIRSVEGRNQILFYTSPACFNIVPKRALETEQLSEVREMLKQNIHAK